jgi:hypothetical protein
MMRIEAMYSQGSCSVSDALGYVGTGLGNTEVSRALFLSTLPNRF